MWCWILNSIQLLLRPISNLMTHFAEETNFLEDLSDLLTKSGTLATSDQCQTHPPQTTQPHPKLLFYFSTKYNFPPQLSQVGAISYTDKVIVGYSSDVAELLSWHLKHLKYYTATITASTLPMLKSSSSSKLTVPIPSRRVKHLDGQIPVPLNLDKSRIKLQKYMLNHFFTSRINHSGKI